MYVYSSQRQAIKYKCEDRDRKNKNQINKAVTHIIIVVGIIFALNT